MGKQIDHGFARALRLAPHCSPGRHGHGLQPRHLGQRSAPRPAACGSTPAACLAGAASYAALRLRSRPRRTLAGAAAEPEGGILGFTEEQVVSTRRYLLTALEFALGLGIGPLSALLYPELRQMSATMQSGDKQFCLEVMGVCGGVPTALQDFFKSTVGLLFGFLLGYTFFFLLARQEKLFNALYEEAEVLTQLLEESQMLLPRQTALQVVRCIRRYVTSSWGPRDLRPAEVYVDVLKSEKDAVEELSRILILDAKQVDGATQVLDCVRQLRMCRARRLAGLQKIIPGLQFIILGTLAVLTAVAPFLDGNGDSSMLSQVLYGVLVSVLALVMFAVQDLSDPLRGFYSAEVQRVQILGALEETLDWIEADAGGGSVARSRGVPSAPPSTRKVASAAPPTVAAAAPTPVAAAAPSPLPSAAAPSVPQSGAAKGQ